VACGCVDRRLWSWESAVVRFLACVGRTPYSSPGEFSMREAEAFIGRLVDFGGLMATGGYPLPSPRHEQLLPSPIASLKGVPRP